MKRRSGLGRGLDALLPSAAAELETRSNLREVAPELLEANPNQPRRAFDDEALEELSASVAALGVLQPLLVRERADGRYELIAGERRLRAARRARLERVPVIVVETDEQGSLERALVENIHREDLNPIEEAMAYRQLIDDGGLTQEQLAEKLSRHRVTITNTLRLLDLPLEIQQYLLEGRLSARHGRILLALQGNPFQVKLAKRIVHEGLSVRAAEEQVRQYENYVPREREPAADPRRAASASEAQRALADHLQTRVRVDVGKKKGKIVIDFVSTEELERLLTVILGRDRRRADGAPDRSV